VENLASSVWFPLSTTGGGLRSVRQAWRVVVKSSNTHDTREAWLRAAADGLRPYFESCGYALPDHIRFAIAFPSTGRKGKRVGECWHSTASADGAYEIFIRADLADPAEVLAVLVKELVHTLLPADAGHGKLFKEAAVRIGLQGPMRRAAPGPLLRDHLKKVAEELGPLPHARLAIDRQSMAARAVDGPRKQGVRMLKAVCEVEGHGYLVRIAATHVSKDGPPHCPKHGPMTVMARDEDDELLAHQPEDGDLREAG
jgi:hypothetical protein